MVVAARASDEEVSGLWHGYGYGWAVIRVLVTHGNVYKWPCLLFFSSR